MSKIENFKFWCQKVLPLVYDDSLSYYELLCKVVSYLNNTIGAVNENTEDMTNLTLAFNDLKNYVNDYFNNVDVQEEINNKLDRMAEDGTLTNLIKNYVDPIYNNYEQIINETIETQNADINVLKRRMDTFASLPSGSTTGDAELIDIRVKANGTVATSAGNAVREQVSKLNENLKQLNDGIVNVTFTDGKYIGIEDGVLKNFAGDFPFKATEEYIPVLANLEYLYTGTLYSSAGIGFYDVSKAFINSISAENFTGEFTTPSNCAYIRLSHYGENTPTLSFKHNISQIEKHIKNIKYMSGENVPLEFTDKYYINESGDLQSFEGDSVFKATIDYVKIEPNIKYRYTGNLFVSSVIAFYDANKVLISYISEENFNGEFTTPSNCVYIRLSNYGNNTPILYSVGYLEDTRTNFKGKYLTIFGDSRSTFINYIPTGYYSHYPNGDVTSVQDMWWKKLINKTGMKLCISNAWGGSTITQPVPDMPDISCMCNDERIENIGYGNIIPDIIIIWASINDYNNYDVPIGNYDGTSDIPVNTTTLTEAYAVMLNKIQVSYPNAKIYVCGETFVNIGSVNGIPCKNINNNITLKEWNKAIENICDIFGVEFIDLSKCGISHYNLSNYYADGLHPNKNGMQIICDYIYEHLSN